MRIGVVCCCILVATRTVSADDRRAEAAITVAIVACEHGAAEKCIEAATEMDRLHVERKLDHTAADLRDRAVELYEQQCAAGDAHACLKHGKELIHDKGAPDVTRGIAQIERGCSLGSGAACLYLGDHHLTGRHVPKDTKRALALFDQACTAGNARACEQLADHLGDADRARVETLHRKACAGDVARGCAASGETRKAAGDRNGAYADMLKACDLGQSWACDKASTLVTEPARARELALRACDSDIANGCRHLADAFAKGIGGERDWGRAMQLAQKACELDGTAPCTQALQIRSHPPDWRCDGEDDCLRLCQEHIAKSCRHLAELRDGAPEAYELACHAGDGASCATRGNQAKRFQDAQQWYNLGCKAGDRMSCMYTQYGMALDGSPDAFEALRATCATDKEACVLVGLVSKEQKPAEADRRFRDACAHNQGLGCRMAAKHARDKKHLAEADKFMKLACKAGDTVACNELPSFDASLSLKRENTPAWE